MKPDSYIIAGPTASGKSAFADTLAARMNGVIINADSVQVYKGIEVISAAPGTRDNYKLFSFLPLSEQLSVAEYLQLARAEYDAGCAAGKTPIFVGGTGFYINALINGISPMPAVSDANRKRARNMAANDLDAAIAQILAVDPEFRFRDPQRVARALEILLETGKPITYWQSQPRVGAIKNIKKILINPTREILIKRIADRIVKMISDGAIDEVRDAIADGWDPRRAIGGEQIAQFIRNEISESEMMRLWTIATNQYAKRQSTWFRTQYQPDEIITNV